MLDKSKEYGEVHGDPTHPYKFEQGDKYFNVHGFECTYEGKQIEFPVEEPAPEPPLRTVMRPPIVHGSIKEFTPDLTEMPPVVPKRKPGRPRKT